MRDRIHLMTGPESNVRTTAEHSGLSERTCRELLDLGWVFTSYADGPKFWIAGGWDALRDLDDWDPKGRA